MNKADEKYSDDEAQRRAEKALRAAFSTPHRTYEESKVGKRKVARSRKKKPDR
jgi:hypothetical protein